jgi:alkylation response protein AidB-like acyl-CoA dehydrogenase
MNLSLMILGALLISIACGYIKKINIGLFAIVFGYLIGAFALTEVLAGSDSFNLRTRAHKDGNEWVINGEKLWITNGAIADLVSVFARTDRGITGFAVETKTPGYIAGPPEKKMGIRGSVTSAITLDNVRVPQENIIGDDGRGFLVAMKTLDAGRLGLGAACTGAAKELLEMSARYAKERKQFDVPIAQFEAIQFMLADMSTLIYCMESIVYRTASAYDAGKAISRESATVKLFCSEALDRVADMAVQIHGGMGYSRELPVERFYRDSRINRIFEGTNEIQKVVISREVLKKNGKV